MIHFRATTYLISILILFVSLTMLIPIGVEKFIFHLSAPREFVLSFFITSFVGGLLFLANRPEKKIEFHVRDAFLITTFSWICLAICGALPFYFSPLKMSFVDSVFETVSGFTTTGFSVIRDVEKAPYGILLWRGLIQLIGGIGIIVIAMVIFPVLRIGGMHLFRSEFSDKSEKILPKMSQITFGIVLSYFILTLLGVLGLWFAGIPLFDSVCQAMGAVSTGGLSTRNESMGAFNNPLAEFICMIIMFMGGMTFILFVRLGQGHWRDIIKDSQTRAYFYVVLFTGTALSLWRYFDGKVSLLESLRHSFFQVISIITSTGYNTTDYTNWGPFPAIFLLFLCVIGGCTGSTAGGIKIFRFQVLYSVALNQLYQLRRPHGIFIPIYNGQKITESDAMSVMTFVTLYLFILGALAVGLALSGLDVVSALSGAASSLGNVGVGVGSHFGPRGVPADLSDTCKELMIFGMLIGRLELFTVLILFFPSFWRN